MTGFEEVEKLKELEQKATPAPWKCDAGVAADFNISANREDFTIQFWDSDEDDPMLITDLRNAAPLLLDVASQIQPGDDKLLAQLVYEQEDLARFVAGFGGVRQSERVMIDLLKRYQKMAERMEEQ